MNNSLHIYYRLNKIIPPYFQVKHNITDKITVTKNETSIKVKKNRDTDEDYEDYVITGMGEDNESVSETTEGSEVSADEVNEMTEGSDNGEATTTITVYEI